MAQSNNAESFAKNPSPSPEEWRKESLDNYEWVKAQEEMLGVNLEEETRRSIAVAMMQKTMTTLEALNLVKSEFGKREGKESEIDAINHIITHFNEETDRVLEDKVVDIVTPEALRDMIDDTLVSTFRSADKTRDKEYMKDMFNAMVRIREIFGQLDREFQTGLIDSDLEELQKEVDDYVEIYKLNPVVFKDCVKRYVDLKT